MELIGPKIKSLLLVATKPNKWAWVVFLISHHIPVSGCGGSAIVNFPFDGGKPVHRLLFVFERHAVL